MIRWQIRHRQRPVIINKLIAWLMIIMMVNNRLHKVQVKIVLVFRAHHQALKVRAQAVSHRRIH